MPRHKHRRAAKPVLIDYEVASVGRRIWAFAFDFGLIQLPYYVFIGWLLLQGYIMAPLTAALYCLPALVYHLLWELFNGGQSPGKRLFRLKVVKLDGTEPIFEQYLVRWACRLIDVAPYGGVAVLMILFAGKGQRLGDKLADTLVVKYDPAVLKQLLNQTNFSTHHFVYPQAEKLTHHQVGLIRKILAQYRKTGDAGPVASLAEIIQRELQLNAQEESSVQFLTQLGQDYDYLNLKNEESNKVANN